METPTKENSIQNGGFMHHKNIKLIIRKQLKKQYPDWNRLKRKVKKHIIREVMTEYASDYDFSRDIATPRSELLGIEQQVPVKGIIKLKEMAKLINKVNQNRIIKFSNYKRSPIYIKNRELQFVDELIDDGIINHLLYYEGYSPSMRGIFPDRKWVEHMRSRCQMLLSRDDIRKPDNNLLTGSIHIVEKDRKL
jgi:hypothetical protein